MNYVLDACAIIAFLDKEEGCEIVNELFERAEAGENIPVLWLPPRPKK